MHRTDVNTDLTSTVASDKAGCKSPKLAGIWHLGERPVNRIGFGAKRLGGSGPIAHRPAGTADARTAGSERVTALLRQAVELGVNHLDTAAFYPSYGRAGEKHEFDSLDWANDAIRRALAPYSDDLLIATKVGPMEHGLARPDQLRGLVEDNLRQLGLETLDLVYLRQAGLTSVAEHFGVLAELRQAGLIRHLGLSNIRSEHLSQAQEIAPVVAVQNRYGVGFGRINDTMLATCGAQGIAFIPFFAVTATGREEGGVADTDPVVAIAREHGATPAQIRIAWTLAKGQHVLAIPGTSNPDHLTENLAAGAINLSPDQLATLDAVPSD
jgi:pyridoxine 4-dehydrogenase